MVNDMFQCAKTYAEWGWCVLPIPRGKKTTWVEWKEYQTRKPTEEEFKQWFLGKTNRQIGIGVVTGKISNISVVDVDIKKDREGNPILDENGNTILGYCADLPPTLRSQTGRGGFHNFYIFHEEAPTVNGIRANTDTKSEGGFIVLPPTIHPDTGKEYTWIIDEFIENHTATLFPIHIFKKDSTNYELKEPLITSEIVGLDDYRNDNLHKLACSLVGKYPEFEAWETIKAFNNTAKPPLEEKELRTLFNSARKFILTNSKNKTYQNDFSRSTNFETHSIPKEYNFVDLATHIENTKPVEWIWKGLIAKGCITLFSALFKAGKSTLLSYLLKALEQTSTSFLNFESKGGKILILSEEPAYIWKKRHEEMRFQTGNFFFLNEFIKQKLNYEEWVTLLKQTAEKAKKENIICVIIDTISNFWSVDNENDAAVVQANVLPLNYFREADIAVVIIHHFRKSGGIEGTAARGSGALASSVDIIMEFTRLYPIKNTTERVIKVLSRFEESPIDEIVIKLDKDNKEYIYCGDKKEHVQDNRLNKILQLMDDNPEGITTKDIIENWDEPITQHKIRRDLKTMELRKQIHIIDEIKEGKQTLKKWSRLY